MYFRSVLVLLFSIGRQPTLQSRREETKALPGSVRSVVTESFLPFLKLDSELRGERNGLQRRKASSSAGPYSVA